MTTEKLEKANKTLKELKSIKDAQERITDKTIASLEFIKVGGGGTYLYQGTLRDSISKEDYVAYQQMLSIVSKMVISFVDEMVEKKEKEFKSLG